MRDAASSETIAAEPRFALLETGLNAARATLDAGDLPAALAAFAALREALPDAAAPFHEPAKALMDRYRFDEAEILLEVAAERFPHDPAVAADYARVAHDRGDAQAALLRWDHARRVFPDDGAIAVGSAKALMGTNQFDAAEMLLRSARTRFPELCQVWTAQAGALIAAERYDEADALLVEAIERFPADADPSIAHARVAASRRDWPQASCRWEILHARHPQNTEGYAGQAAVWRDLGQFDAADAVLNKALGLFPDDPGLLVAFASVAQAKRDWPAAIERWAQVRRRFPGHADAFVASVVTLRDACRHREAETLAVEAQRRFPAHPAPAIEFARLAEARGDEAAATARWNKARIRFPWVFAPVGKRPEPLAAPAVVASHPIRVAVAGFHLAHQVSLLLGRMIPFRTKLEVEWINAGMDLDTIRTRLPDGWLDDATVYFEESMVGDAAAKRGIRVGLPTGCDIRTFPTSSLLALWPFQGRDARLVPEPPIYNDGRYFESDAVAASLVNPAVTDDALFDMYMELTEAAPLDLDALFAADLDRMRAEDRDRDVQLAGFVEAHFREHRLFATPHERCTPIVKEVARQLLATPALQDICDLDAALAGLDRLTLGWCAHGRAVPVHPRVVRHFGLTWWSPDMTYELGRNRFAFREYIIRYMRWSPWLV